MGKDNITRDNIKIIFSLISVILMIPLLINSNESYYRTLFIFLINSVIDMFFDSKDDEPTYFVVWSLINQWICVVACAIAFCSITPDFAAVCQTYAKQINLFLFASALSCIIKNMIVLIVASVKEKLILKNIKKDLNERKGESL